jgi:hypothetical protein
VYAVILRNKRPSAELRLRIDPRQVTVVNKKECETLSRRLDAAIATVSRQHPIVEIIVLGATYACQTSLTTSSALTTHGNNEGPRN